MRYYRLDELNEQAIEGLCTRNPLWDEEIFDTCRRAFREVAADGDAALRRWTLRLDGVELGNFEVAAEEFEEAQRQVDSASWDAMRHATANIRRFHASERALVNRIEVQPGVICWRESRPIGRVGLYVPAGTAPLPSTVLMLGVPARVAGCPERIVCAPPRKDGSVAPEILAACQTAEISRVFKVGGAQAIAALALGTESIPRVDKIFGPGNRWVQGAKLLAQHYGVAMDLPAGPSEVLVIADESADPRFAASDLLAQAEHGADSQVVLVTTCVQLFKSIRREMDGQLRGLPRRDTVERCLDNSFTLLAEDIPAAIDFSNRYAPEHLVLQIEDPHRWLSGVLSAGSVFLGPWSPEVAGDYASGTNHTLPTSGTARSCSGVSLHSFLKTISFQELTESGLEDLSPTLQRLARDEGLEAHRRAVALRIEALPRLRPQAGRFSAMQAEEDR